MMTPSATILRLYALEVDNTNRISQTNPKTNPFFDFFVSLGSNSSPRLSPPEGVPQVFKLALIEPIIDHELSILRRMAQFCDVGINPETNPGLVNLPVNDSMVVDRELAVRFYFHDGEPMIPFSERKRSVCRFQAAQATS